MKLKRLQLFILLSFAFTLEIGDIPAKFYLRDINDKDFFLSDQLKKNTPVLLNFFATWCAPCRQELPKLDSLSYIYKDIDFVYIGSGTNRSPLKFKDIIKFKNDLELTQKILLDKYGRTYEKYSPNNLLPLTLLIDNNQIVYLAEEYDKETSIEYLVNEIKKVLNEE